MNHSRTNDTRTLPDGSREVRYRCSCGTVGSAWYTEDKYGSGTDHARKAWQVHAYYAERTVLGVVRSR